MRNIFYKLTFLKSLFSPFKPFKLMFYCGKTKIGTPYFLPRRMVKCGDHYEFRKKLIGFDFVGLGWKTKWDEYRFEWRPIISFVFLKWQIAIQFIAPHESYYWECWLTYKNMTNKSIPIRERILEAKEINPCIWSRFDCDKKITICYWDLILKYKYL